MRSISLPKPGVWLSCILVLAFSASAVLADDWRPISPADLQSKAPIVDPGADAEAIFWEVRIDDSSYWDLSMKHYVRVKIFTERGRELYSKFDIPFTKGLSIKDLAARVIKADGSIVEIKKDDIFEREIVRTNGLKIKAKSFAIPNIEPGVIVEYRYKEKVSDSGAAGMRLEFQRDIPVRELSYYYKPFEGQPKYKTFNFSEAKFVKDRDGYYVASRMNVPAFKQEPYMPPDDSVRPWMRLSSSRISIFGMLAKMELHKTLKKDSGDMKKTAAEIVGGAATDVEKLEKLYEFCQTQIANNNFDPTITDEMREKLPQNKSSKDVLKRKAGSAMDIDLLFGSLATGLGMEARIAFVGDRSKMLTSARELDQEFLKAGAIAVKVGDRWRFFNPGGRFLPFGTLVWYEENSAAELVGEKDFVWVQTPFSDHNFTSTKRTGSFRLTDDGSLEGEVSVTLSGQQAINYRFENYDETPDKLAQLIGDDVKRQIPTAEVAEVVLENLLDASKPLVQRYKVKVPKYAQRTGKRIFIQPNVFEYGRSAAFAESERKYDIFFRYPWSEKDNIEIIWPAGFELDSPETPGAVADRSKIGALQVSMSTVKADRKLTYTREFYFGGGGNVLFPSSTYPPLKNLFDEFHKADTHTITLKQL